MATNLFFEWASLITSVVLFFGWLVVFKRWWPRMIVHMGPVYTYLIPVMLLSGISLRIARALILISGWFDVVWYILFGVWVSSSIAALWLFLRKKA